MAIWFVGVVIESTYLFLYGDMRGGGGGRGATGGGAKAVHELGKGVV